MTKQTITISTAVHAITLEVWYERKKNRYHLDDWKVIEAYDTEIHKKVDARKVELMVAKDPAFLANVRRELRRLKA